MIASHMSLLLTLLVSYCMAITAMEVRDYAKRFREETSCDEEGFFKRTKTLMALGTISPADVNNIPSPMCDPMNEPLQELEAQASQSPQAPPQMNQDSILASGHVVILPEPSTKISCKNDEMFECGLNGCDYVAKYPSIMTIHRWTHAVQRPFQCAVCARPFTQKAEGNVHFRAHHPGKVAEVVPTDPSDATLTTLRAAVIIRTPRKKKFLTNNNVPISHAARHSMKKFVCGFQDCLTQAKNPWEIRRHRWMHTQQREFQCSVCEKFFLGYNKWHHRKKHPSQDVEFKQVIITAETQAVLDWPIKEITQESVQFSSCEDVATSKCSICKAAINIHNSQEHFKKFHQELGILIGKKSKITDRTSSVVNLKTPPQDAVQNSPSNSAQREDSKLFLQDTSDTREKSSVPHKSSAELFSDFLKRDNAPKSCVENRDEESNFVNSLLNEAFLNGEHI